MKVAAGFKQWARTHHREVVLGGVGVAVLLFLLWRHHSSSSSSSAGTANVTGATTPVVDSGAGAGSAGTVDIPGITTGATGSTGGGKHKHGHQLEARLAQIRKDLELTTLTAQRRHKLLAAYESLTGHKYQQPGRATRLHYLEAQLAHATGARRRNIVASIAQLRGHGHKQPPVAVTGTIHNPHHPVRRRAA